jgi:hypothetical protein
MPRVVKRVALVACVAKKLSTPAPAKDLYISPLFKFARRYAESRADMWYILSAKYGLVNPEEVISPYEQTLNRMSSHTRRNWSRLVLSMLYDEGIQSGDTTIFLAGERYRSRVEEELSAKGVLVEVPMLGLSIGRQLQWLKNQPASS